uniref:Uncharacterized protein n=1 Tax=Anopheles albimanus TaxID=7167 RepID=A0A182FDC5_ANOAL
MFLLVWPRYNRLQQLGATSTAVTVAPMTMTTTFEGVLEMSNPKSKNKATFSMDREKEKRVREAATRLFCDKIQCCMLLRAQDKLCYPKRNISRSTRRHMASSGIADDGNFSLLLLLLLRPVKTPEGVCGCGECATGGGGVIPASGGVGGGAVSGGTVATASGAMGAPSNGSKTAHSKVATGGGGGGGGHANTQQTSSKRSSSGADGDYQLVQHEVLYSLSAQYERK